MSSTVLGALGDTQKPRTWGCPQIAHCLFEKAQPVPIKAFIHPTDMYLLGWELIVVANYKVPESRVWGEYCGREPRGAESWA